MANIHKFKCSCANSKDLNFKEFKEHLSEAHGLKTDADLKGKREMVMHMDGAKFYSSTYSWTLESGLTFSEYSEQTRTKKDSMMWG